VPGGSLEVLVQTVGGGLAGVVVAGAWHAARQKTRWQAFDNFIEDWNGKPPRPGVPAHPGVMERLAILEDGQGTRAEVQEQQSGALLSLGAAVDQIRAWMEAQGKPPSPPQQRSA